MPIRATNIGRKQRSTMGLTTLQAVVSIAVIAGVAAAMLVLMRGQQWKRARALAYTQPGDVFELRARPTKQAFSWDEDIVISCNFTNKTNYELAVPELFTASLTIDDEIIVSGGSPIGYQHILKPGEIVTQDLRLSRELIGLPHPSGDLFGTVKLVFHGRGHSTEPERLASNYYSQSIKPGAPVLRSREFEISISENFRQDPNRSMNPSPAPSTIQ